MARKNPGKALGGAAKQGVDNVGARAKLFRLDRRMTLEQLAELTGVSKGHLSRFERGQKSLSLAMLIRLAEALHSSVAELLGELPARDKSHLVKAEGRTYHKASASDGKYIFSALGRGDDPLINAFLVEFTSGTEMRKSAEAYHSGQEIFFILEGAVEIDLGGRKHVLNKGDYLQFPGSVRHNVRGLRKRSRVLVVVVQR